MILAEVSESGSEKNTVRNDDQVGIFIALRTIIMVFVLLSRRNLLEGIFHILTYSTWLLLKRLRIIHVRGQ